MNADNIRIKQDWIKNNKVIAMSETKKQSHGIATLTLFARNDSYRFFG